MYTSRHIKRDLQHQNLLEEKTPRHARTHAWLGQKSNKKRTGRKKKNETTTASGAGDFERQQTHQAPPAAKKRIPGTSLVPGTLLGGGESAELSVNTQAETLKQIKIKIMELLISRPTHVSSRSALVFLLPASHTWQKRTSTKPSEYVICYCEKYPVLRSSKVHYETYASYLHQCYCIKSPIPISSESSVQNRHSHQSRRCYCEQPSKADCKWTLASESWDSAPTLISSKSFPKEVDAAEIKGQDYVTAFLSRVDAKKKHPIYTSRVYTRKKKRHLPFF